MKFPYYGGLIAIIRAREIGEKERGRVGKREGVPMQVVCQEPKHVPAEGDVRFPSIQVCVAPHHPHLFKG
jgi:hypothetical protein